jgi:hypothetical protein
VGSLPSQTIERSNWGVCRKEGSHIGLGESAVSTASRRRFRVIGVLLGEGGVLGGTRPVTTSTANGPLSGDSTPLLALLICLAFGGLGVAAVEAQRRRIRS